MCSRLSVLAPLVDGHGTWYHIALVPCTTIMIRKRPQARSGGSRGGRVADPQVTVATLIANAVTPFPSAYNSERIASLRHRLNLSQPVFAAALNVSPETVKKWEQGTRVPDGATVRLLELAEQHPEWVLKGLARVRDDTSSSNKIVKKA